MASFLFLTWNGGGTTVPVRAITRELLSSGHDVRVLGHGAQAAQFTRDGIPFAAYPRAGSFVVSASPLNLLALMRDPQTAKDVDEELDAHPADLVVADPLLLSTLRVLSRRNQRYALLEATVDTLMRPRLRRLGFLLWFLGLRVRKLLAGAHTVVVASAGELDPGAGDDAVHIGSMMPAVASQATSSEVLISLSTFPFRHLNETWQRLLEAVTGLPLQVIATTGPSLDPTELDPPTTCASKSGWIMRRCCPESRPLLLTAVTEPHLRRSPTASRYSSYRWIRVLTSPASEESFNKRVSGSRFHEKHPSRSSERLSFISSPMGISVDAQKKRAIKFAAMAEVAPEPMC